MSDELLRQIAGRLRSALRATDTIFGSELRSTASVGIVTSDHSQASADRLLDALQPHADSYSVALAS